MGIGIFKPTEIKGDIVIYSKWCVQCDYPVDLLVINGYAINNDLEVQIVRTAYRPADHQKAIELWRCRDDAPEGETDEMAEQYPAFVLYEDKIYRLRKFIEMIGENTKDKMVKEGKTKDDLQGLPQTKRHSRKNSVASATNDAETKDV